MRTRRFIRYALPNVRTVRVTDTWGVDVDVETDGGTFHVCMDRVWRLDMYGFAQVNPPDGFLKANPEWVEAHDWGSNGLCYDVRLVATLHRAFCPVDVRTLRVGECLELMGFEEARGYLRANGVPTEVGEAYDLMMDADAVDVRGIPEAEAGRTVEPPPRGSASGGPRMRCRKGG